MGLVALLATVFVLSACGGSGKPAYCSSVSNLKQSVKDLANVKPVQNGTSSVTAAVNKVKDNADAAISAAKSDFSTETQALKTAVDTLVSSVKTLPTATASTLPALPSQVAAVTTAATNLANATQSKCS
jgi:phage-related protein